MFIIWAFQNGKGELIHVSPHALPVEFLSRCVKAVPLKTKLTGYIKGA